MARSKPTARDALKKLREQRAQLENEEARLREEAATELGRLLIECGAETIDPAQLRQIVRASMALGIEEGRADAVLAASVFHFGEISIPDAKRFLAARGIEMRL